MRLKSSRITTARVAEQCVTLRDSISSIEFYYGYALSVLDLNHDVLCSKHGVPDVLYVCSKQLESIASTDAG